MAPNSDSGLKVSKVYFDPEEIIFQEGDPPAGLFLIEDGSVEVYRLSGHRTVRMARLGRGEVVGELALIEGIPHTRSVRALDHVTALKVEPGDLETALGKSPALIRMILKRVVRKLHRTNDVAFGQTRKPT